MLTHTSTMSLRILICPLHWGLGHAARCRSIIDYFVDRGHEVHVASDGLAFDFLRLHHPQLPAHRLAPLEIRYGRLFWYKLFTQSFYVFKWMVKDKIRLKELQAEFGFDLILSDSRPACRLKGVASVLLIHQAKPILPWKILGKVVQLVMKNWMSRFDRIWIPDIEVNGGLSGNLGNLTSSIQERKIGFLTKIIPSEAESPTQYQCDILAVVSGPEPMRTRFEHSLRVSLRLADKLMMVGGRPDLAAQSNGYLSFVNQSTLTGYISVAQYIICRAGYSTLMDLAAWSKKLILVPTPGQTEQWYLARRLVDLDMAVIWDIEKEDWELVKERVDQCQRFHLDNNQDLLMHAVADIEQYCEKKINFRR